MLPLPVSPRRLHRVVPLLGSHALAAGRPRGERWLLPAEELLGLLLVLPLVYFDFRAGVSPVVSCSDASEQGGGVCVARALSAVGREAALRRLRPLANLFRGRVGLWESFAGIGGARRAFELLGIHPAFYVAVKLFGGHQRRHRDRNGHRQAPTQTRTSEHDSDSKRPT